MSHPSFEEFYAALADPSRRPLIGLVISDDDAWSLLENDEWARSYFDDWLALAPPSDQAKDERVVDAAQPARASVVPALTAPARVMPVTATPARVVPVSAPTTPPRRLPRWALAAIISGAAVALLGAVGALVIAGIGARGEIVAGGPAESSSPEPTVSAEPGENPLPWEAGYVAPYSEADAAAYLAIVEPLFGSESSSAASSDSYLLLGASACVSIDAGFAESAIVDPMVQASGGRLTADEGQTMLEAAKTYLCQ